MVSKKKSNKVDPKMESKNKQDKVDPAIKKYGLQ